MQEVKFTAPRVLAFRCPKGKDQHFQRDQDTAGLLERATKNQHLAYVFQSGYRGETVRMTIGSPHVWTIPQAQARARELQRLIDIGRDPREVVAEIVAADVAKRDAEAGAGLRVADVWPHYMREGKPRKKDQWKPRYLLDLHKAAALGGDAKKRGKGVMKPGHLAALMPMRLVDIDQDVIRDWYVSEKQRAPIQAARAVAMFSGFVSWCGTRKEYRALVHKDCAKASGLSDILPAIRRRTDAIEIDQLPGWFAGVEKLRSRTAAAYLQALLLCGARREEMAALRWADVDFRWRKITLSDKVSTTRLIPMAPYMEGLLRNLPRVNEYVFASATSASRRITEPRSPHAEVLADAGIPHVSIHGLRRSFSLLGEAAGAPAGALAQLMGHRPSGVAEGYRPRSIDALRPYLATVEAFILKCAGVDFDPATAVRATMRVVVAA